MAALGAKVERLSSIDAQLRMLVPGKVSEAGFTFSFFYRIPPTPGNEISAEISPNFANSERKENSNSKNEISVISTEISVISTGK